VKAIEKTMEINQLKIAAEKTKLLPVWYKMTICLLWNTTSTVLLDGNDYHSMPWSTKMNKANISYHIKMKVSIGKTNDIE
jgi:hypothetical protein